MTKKEYETKRNALMKEIQALIDAGKAKEAQEKMNAVKALDAEWDAIAQAQANFAALNKEPEFKGIIIDNSNLNNSTQQEKPTDLEIAWASDEYKTAWAKNLMDKKMSDDEKDAFRMVNEAYTHTTENTGVVIPKTVASRIWELVGEMYPYFADIAKSYVNGVFSMIQEDTSTDAAWYDEDSSTEDGQEKFKEFNLSGCELSRAITVSWKLKEMAIDDFIPYIEKKMAKKMGAAAGYGATHGKGKVQGQKPEPTGVVTALLAEENTPQVVTYKKGEVPSYTQITKARSKIKSGYGSGLAVYANSVTIWNVLANIMDQNNRPLFVQDPTAGGSFRVLGMVVKEDDSMQDGEILLSNAYAGYHNNTNREMSMTTEDHAKKRITDYCGYAIMDGNVVTTKAHALLKYA